MGQLSIGAVAREAGIAVSAIRYYEEQGLLPPAQRVSGRRMYRPEIFDDLAVIKIAQAAGFTISEIRQLTVALGDGGVPGRHLRAFGQRKLKELEEQVRTATAMQELLRILMSCGCSSVSVCAHQARKLLE